MAEAAESRFPHKGLDVREWVVVDKKKGRCTVAWVREPMDRYYLDGKTNPLICADCPPGDAAALEAVRAEVRAEFERHHGLAGELGTHKGGMRIELDLTGAELDRLELVSWFDDAGPQGEGWQSPAAESLGKKIREAVERAREAFRADGP